MKKTKIFISLLLLIFIAIGFSIGYILTNITHEEFEATATVIERRSASELVVKLDEEPKEKLKNELIVKSNIFRINDKVKIKYTRKGNDDIITDIDALTETDIDKANLASKMTSDPTIIKYTNSASVKFQGDSTNIEDLLVMPVQLSNQKFNFMTEIEYLRNYHGDFDINSTHPKDTEIIISVLKDFKVVSVESITEDNRVNLLYNITNKNITFKSVESSIYSVKLDFKNGDIINYIFIG